MSRFRPLIVHDLPQARAAARVASALGQPLSLESPPAGSFSLGAGVFHALVEIIRAEFPGLEVTGILDCADAPGHALAALRTGVDAVRVDCAPDVRARLAAIAARLDRRIEDGTRPALDLAAVADPVAACRTWFAEDPAAPPPFTRRGLIGKTPPRRIGSRRTGPDPMNIRELEETARALVAPGKGILAADESSSTIKKRLDGIKVESSEENRRAYRELLFTTAGSGEHISGAILYDETIRQSASDGRPFPEVLKAQGTIPGIKVDKSTKPLPFAPGEVMTEGLDGLRERCAEYYKLGARFSKWRAVIKIGDGIPSRYCIETNAHALARYAALSQEQGLVPIVEPEVLMDGAHDIERCRVVTEETLVQVFYELYRQRVVLEGMLLKPNMVISGSDCPKQASHEEVAAATVKSLKRCVPAAVPGIVFLSGGQSEEEATANLNAMNAMGSHPWKLSFSYGRALQQSALKAWGGRKENVPAAQKAYAHRAKMNGLAAAGRWKADLEKERAA